MSDKPPKLDLSKGYEFWKKQLNSWVSTTDTDAKKHAHLVVLHSLDQKLQEEIYAKISDENLVATNCLKNVTDYLDNKFIQSDSLKQYLFFDEFTEYRRPEEMSILEFTEEFERKVNKLEAAKCKLPDAVLAHALVKNAGLSDIAKATLKASCAEMTYANVKTNLLKIYSNQFGNSSTHTREFKEEAMYNRSDSRSRGRFRSRGQYRGQYRGNKRFNDNKDDNNKNPIDPNTGKPYLCFNCEADDHMVRYCPHPRRGNNNSSRRRGQRNSDNRYPTYYNESEQDEDKEQEIHINLLDLGIERL